MIDSILAIIVLVAVGVGAGIFGSMLGVGGGVIMVPALTFLGISPAQTASTSLIAVSSTSVSSTIEYSRQKRIDYRLGFAMAGLAIPGAVVGALLSADFTMESFRLYFGILLALSGLYVLHKNSILREQHSVSGPSTSRYLAVGAASVAAGMISSIFGVGGGIVFVPAMLLILRIGIHRAVVTSQLTLMITSIAGVFTHAALGHPDYLYATALSAGAFVGAQIGARLSKSVRDVLLQKILGASLIIISGKFIADWLLLR